MNDNNNNINGYIYTQHKPSYFSFQIFIHYDSESLDIMGILYIYIYMYFFTAQR